LTVGSTPVLTPLLIALMSRFVGPTLLYMSLYDFAFLKVNPGRTNH